MGEIVKPQRAIRRRGPCTAFENFHIIIVWACIEPYLFLADFNQEFIEESKTLRIFYSLSDKKEYRLLCIVFPFRGSIPTKHRYTSIMAVG